MIIKTLSAILLWFSLLTITAQAATSPPSNIASGTTYPLPAAPIGVTAVTTNNSVVVTWNANLMPDAGGYFVFRNGTLISTINTNSLTDGTVIAGSNYCYTIKAFDVSTNTSAASASACVVPSNPTPPPMIAFSATPTNGIAPLTVTFNDQSVGIVTNIQWNCGDGNTLSISSPVHTYSTAGVYTVTMTIAGPGGTVTLTKTNCITVVAPPVLTITTPTDYQTVSTNSLVVSGTVTGVIGIASLTVNNLAIALNGNWTTTVTLINGTNLLTAIATDPDQNATTQSVHVIFTPPLPPPANLVATAVSASEIDLVWSNTTTGLQGTTIYQSNTATGPWAQINTVGPTNTTYNVTGLTSNTSYFFQVAGFD